MDQTTDVHIGLTSLEGERTKLLQVYDAAVAQAADDPVKTEHGVACEAQFRAFLEQFLPKKYGVTKGYIVTPDCQYAGPMEEWDIIIYDAMEAPVLFVRRNQDEGPIGWKRGVPVEYVSGVIEVKATFNEEMAGKAAEKLLKLRAFMAKDSNPGSAAGTHLPEDFSAFAVFFETKVKGAHDYKKALQKLTAFWHPDPLLQFAGALIMRGQTCRGYSASTSYVLSGFRDLEDRLIEYCEVSGPEPSFLDGMNAFVYSGGYGPNEFWEYMINMVHYLNGKDPHGDVYDPRPEKLIGGYGQRRSAQRNVRLFPRDGEARADDDVQP